MQEIKSSTAEKGLVRSNMASYVQFVSRTYEIRKTKTHKVVIDSSSHVTEQIIACHVAYVYSSNVYTSSCAKNFKDQNVSERELLHEKFYLASKK